MKLKEMLQSETGIPLSFAPNLKTGMQGPAGICSSLNTSRNQKATLSLAAVVLDQMKNGRISVCTVNGQMQVYTECQATKKNDVYNNYITSYDDGKQKFTVLIDNNTVDGDENSDSPYLSGIVALVLYNAMSQASFHTHPELDTVIAKNPADWSESDAYLICDWMFYALGDKTIEIRNCSDFKIQLSRLEQGQHLTHVPKTIKPVNIKLVQKKQKKKEQDTLFTEPLDVFFARCKDGAFLIDYPWNDIQKRMIVPLEYLDSFIPTETFREVLLSTYFQIQNILKKMNEGISYNAIMGKNSINIKIMGKPGTGKTSVIEAVLASLGYPKGLINCKSRMEEDEIEGQNKFINGSVRSIPTKAGELHSVGGAIVLEEINLPDPGILQGGLGQALVYPFILKMDGYMESKRHPLTIYFATMNIGVNGTKPMNEALSSRFAEGYILEDVPENEFIQILEGDGYSAGNCKSVYRVYTAILNYLREYQEDLVLSVTLRHCLNALDKMSIGFPLKKAVENTFISQIYSSDPDVAKDIRDNVLRTFV